MNEETSPAQHERYHGFWPVLLIGCSLALILIWEIQVGVATRRSSEQLREQQLHLVDQARRVQGELQKVVRGLVDLAKTDDDAKRIVNRFGIKVNNPTIPESTPSP
jgi:hypothetical protein